MFPPVCRRFCHHEVQRDCWPTGEFHSSCAKHKELQLPYSSSRRRLRRVSLLLISKEWKWAHPKQEFLVHEPTHVQEEAIARRQYSNSEPNSRERHHSN